VPLFERNLLIAADEANVLRGTDRQLRVWIVDIREESNPVPVDTAPIPRGFDTLRDTGGLVGPHNINENEPVLGCARFQNTVVVAWYGAGVRVFEYHRSLPPRGGRSFSARDAERTEGVPDQRRVRGGPRVHLRRRPR